MKNLAEVTSSKYAAYCKKLQTERKNGSLKNPRAVKMTEEKLTQLYKDVESEGLEFDGIHITHQSTGVSYDYVALKNKMLLSYPESKIDISLVYDLDEFSFGKENGSISYKHIMSNPFERKDENIIGAYTIIRNKRGEFLTTLSKEDLEKHRKTAKTDYIWKQWYREMCMKTIMKKACKLHFGDIFTGIDEQDNENYSLDNPIDIDLSYKQEIDEIETIKELAAYYKANEGKGKDFVKYVSLRKTQLNEST